MELWHEADRDGSGNKGNINGDQCNNDCNPPTSLTYPLPSNSSIPTTELSTRQFQLISPCWIQECTQDRWIVCNPTGAGQIIVVDEEAKQILDVFHSPYCLNILYKHKSTGEIASIHHVISILWKLGFLLQVGAQPPPLTETRSDTLTAWMHITNACNLRCTYCYIHKSTEHMSQETAFNAVDALLRSAKIEGYKYLTLKYAGGEASLQMKQLITVHDYATQKASEVGIELHGVLLTNGVMITQNMIEQLKARAFNITISLDGIGTSNDTQRPFKNGRGSFEYIDRSIKHLLANRVEPHITITITQQNLTGLPDLIAYILQQNLTFKLNFYRDNDYIVKREQMAYQEHQMIEGMRAVYRVIEEHLPRHSLLHSLIDLTNLQTQHHHTCGVGKNYLAITHKGEIAKCHMAQGQVLTTVAAANPLRVIQNDQRGLQNLPVEEKEGCRECLWRFWCGGGCPLLTFRMTGRYDIKSPNCHIYQALFPNVLRLEALRLLRYTSPLRLNNAPIF